MKTPFSLSRNVALLTLVGAALVTGCTSSGTRSSTVIDPPKPPGLPDPPALRVPNPPGAEPPSVGDTVRVEREPASAPAVPPPPPPVP